MSTGNTYLLTYIYIYTFSSHDLSPVERGIFNHVTSFESGLLSRVLILEFEYSHD